MHRRLVAIVAALGVASGCARESANRPAPVATATVSATSEPTPSASAPASAPASPSATAPASAPAPVRTACADDFPKADMIRDNIADTSITGIAEIVATSRTGTDGKSPAPTTGYVNNVYEVRVVKWLSGTGAEKLVLKQGAEAEITPLAPGALLFFSACSAKDGSAWEPDVGYFFSVDPSCRAEVEKMGEAAAKRATAIGKRKRACSKTK
jgi:hypothetical protein